MSSPPDDNTGLQQQINRLMARADMQDERFRELSEELETTKNILARLMLTPAEGGMFPPVPQIERFVAQVFHKPEMASELNREGGKTPWSLKIEYWHRAKKQPHINFALYSPKHVLRVLRDKNPPTHIIDAVSRADPERTLVGLVRRKLQNGGSPYVADQMAILIDYTSPLASDVRLALFIGMDAVFFESFVTSNGSKKNRSRWVASHVPDRK